MKITARQKEILGNLMDLYRENRNSPVHYTVVAERLGISKWSAYDMLKVLEEKGFVKANYEMSEEVKGRGRSSVVFSPSEGAHSILNELYGNEIDREEWQKVKDLVMKKLDLVEGTKHEKLFKSILKMIPEENGK